MMGIGKSAYQDPCQPWLSGWRSVGVFWIGSELAGFSAQGWPVLNDRGFMTGSRTAPDVATATQRRCGSAEWLGVAPCCRRRLERRGAELVGGLDAASGQRATARPRARRRLAAGGAVRRGVSLRQSYILTLSGLLAASGRAARSPARAGRHSGVSGLTASDAAADLRREP
jgi:hypothetical protein